MLNVDEVITKIKRHSNTAKVEIRKTIPDGFTQLSVFFKNNFRLSVNINQDPDEPEEKLDVGLLDNKGQLLPLSKTEGFLAKDGTGKIELKELNSFLDWVRNDIPKMVGKSMSGSIADIIRKTAQVFLSVDLAKANKDPNELSRHVLPMLTLMGIQNLIDRPKTQIIVGPTKKGLVLYNVSLRRENKISEDIIERIKRQKDNFDSIKWTAKALEVHLWYDPPPEEQQTQPIPGYSGS